jgi:hypothetical protein
VTLELARPTRFAERGFGLSRPASRLAVLVAFGPVVGLAGAQGGYFPSAWGWATLPLLWLSALALVLRDRVCLSRPERLFLGLLTGLTLWILVSAVWSVAPAASILESQRGLLYTSLATAALVVSRSRDVSRLLGGLLTAICGVAAFSLTTRLLPDRIGVFDSGSVYRLAQPIGSWNGLAIFTGMGALLALAFATRARSLWTRAAAAGSLVLLLPTFYFTFGRGPWIALGLGILAAVATDPRRLQLLAGLAVLAPVPAFAVWTASHRSGLTHAGVPLNRATHDGHQLFFVLLVLAGINAAAALAFAYADRRFSPPPAGRRAFGGAIVLFAIIGLGFVFLRWGGPTTLAQKGYRAFKSPVVHSRGDLNARLRSFSGNGRADLWRLAWDDAAAHPVLGAGAGTYERYFLAHQPADISRVRDAHGLYIETLAELGPAGLILLLGTLVIPLAGLKSVRAHPLIPGAAGAYVAYLVHTGIDWDWELPAVTIAGLLCAASLLIAGRRSSPARPVSARTRWVGVVALIAAAAFAAVGLVGNTSLSRSDAARRSQDWARAARDARLAESWMPWSPQTWEALGRAQLGAGALPEARMSFRKAISMDGGDWELWYRLAGASAGQERRHALREADRLFPRAQLLRAAGAAKP